jgi:hypothetical protein
MENIIKVSNATVRNLYKPKDGDVIFQEDTKEFFVYKDNAYIPMPEEAGVQMSLYEMNAQIIEQLSPMNREALRAKKKDFRDFIDKTNNKFYMLYGKEISYFTLFNNLDPTIGYVGYDISTDFFVVLVECLHNIGQIKSFDLTKAKDAYEIWVTTATDNKTTCLYFFPYDTGLVYVQEVK